MKTNKIIRIVMFFVGALIPIAMYFIPVSEPLTPKSMLALGFLIMAVLWTVAGTMKDYQSMIAMCALLSVTGCVEWKVAFGQYASTTWWLMLAGCGIGVAAVKCGFLTRVAYLMLKYLPATYGGQCMAYILSGLLMSPIIPSSTAKGAIIAPMAKETAHAMGIPDHSKGAAGLFTAAITGYVSIALAFLSGSAVNYSVIGTMPKGYTVSWTKWFITAIPWMIVANGLMALVIVKLYKPKDLKPVDKTYINQALEKMGPMSMKEKTCLIVVVGTIVLWIAQPLHGLPPEFIAIASMLSLFATGVCPPSALKDLAWTALLFVGSFLCLPTVFKTLGINDWLALLLGDRLAPLMSNMYALLPVIAILTYLLRILLVSLSATAILVTTLLLPFCSAYGIHPFVIAFACYVSTNTWNVPYQNTVTVAALATSDPWLTHAETRSTSMWYMITNIIGILASIPIWKMMGLC